MAFYHFWSELPWQVKSLLGFWVEYHPQARFYAIMMRVRLHGLEGLREYARVAAHTSRFGFPSEEIIHIPDDDDQVHTGDGDQPDVPEVWPFRKPERAALCVYAGFCAPVYMDFGFFDRK